MSEIDGTIKNAYRDGTVVVGTIYGDKKKRFLDGTKICTSRVMEELPNNIIRTRNSVYRVEWANTPTERGNEEKRLFDLLDIPHYQKTDNVFREIHKLAPIVFKAKDAEKKALEADLGKANLEKLACDTACGLLREENAKLKEELEQAIALIPIEQRVEFLKSRMREK